MKKSMMMVIESECDILDPLLPAFIVFLDSNNFILAHFFAHEHAMQVKAILIFWIKFIYHIMKLATFFASIASLFTTLTKSLASPISLGA